MLKQFRDNEINLNQEYCLFGIALIHFTSFEKIFEL